MREVNEDEFKDVISSSKLVLVDFYAKWCGPCEIQSEILHKLQNSRNTLNFEIIKVNVDKFPKLSIEYGVDAIPTLKIFKNNELKRTLVGVTSEEKIIDIMNSYDD